MLSHHLSFIARLLVTLLFCVGVLGVGYSAHAQDGVGIRIQPSTLDERADPGTSIEGALTVTNQDGGTQKYYLVTRNIENMDDSGRPVFSKTPASDPMEAAAWVQLSTSEITLEQGASIEVPYRIEIPSAASPGSYFAAIFVTREADRATESGAGVGFQVASLLNLRVNGTAVEGIMIREFSSNKAFYTKPEALFTTRIENTGTVHERPRGIIEISDIFGKKFDQVTINEHAGGIMPRTDRVFETSWNTEKFTLGRYTASVSIVFGDAEKQTLTRDTTFWVIPLKEVGLVLGGVLLLAWCITWGMRRYVRNALARAGHTPAQVQKIAEQTSFAKRLTRTFSWLLVILALLFIGTLVFFA